jgi:hypothetical protein
MAYVCFDDMKYSIVYFRSTHSKQKRNTAFQSAKHILLHAKCVLEVACWKSGQEVAISRTATISERHESRSRDCLVQIDKYTHGETSENWSGVVNTCNKCTWSHIRLELSPHTLFG